MLLNTRMGLQLTKSIISRRLTGLTNAVALLKVAPTAALYKVVIDRTMSTSSRQHAERQDLPSHFSRRREGDEFLTKILPTILEKIYSTYTDKQK